MKEDEDDNDAHIPQSQDPSFLRRLAGPSAHKAGIAKDQTEVNRLIAEVSRGSKFYNNEKRRDADWTIRINKILTRRNELLRESDIGRVEAKVDRLFAEMESRRDLSQTIVHVDMDAFFANVELQHNPELKDKPFAVVGLGIVTTASYDARKFGVRSAMPEFVAKKLCPEIILVPVDYKRVGVVSSKVMAICKQYDPNMLVAGCDEGYLNITEYLKEHNLDAAEVTNLTASAGIAPNMICSDRNKPNGQFLMPFEREAVMDFMRDLPVRKVPYIGRVGERVLESIGVKTCGDIHSARAVIYLMPKKFSVDFLFKAHLGLSPTVLKPSLREERKSVGASRTFRPVHTKDAIFEKLEYIASLLERDLEAEGWAGKIVILTYKLDTFRVHTRRATFKRWISKKEDLVNIGKELIKPYLPMRVRLIGLRVTDLKDLRKPTDQGIMRYFESGPEYGPESPSKRRKLGHPPSRVTEPPSSPSNRRLAEKADGISLDEPLIVYDGEEEEEELVGEAAEDEDELDEEEEEDEEEENKQRVERDLPVKREEHEVPCFRAIKVGNDKPRFRPKKPASAITRERPVLPASGRSKSEQPVAKPKDSQSKSTSPQPPFSNSESKSKANTKALTSREHGSTEVLVCPVCSRVLETDNIGLNTHIDFCLSRGAIITASSTAVSSMAETRASVTSPNKKDKGKSADRRVFNG
ncbi:DNA/RNA polymerase [Phellopilus nigrolimitatus]|nr:DNA/RNA polymerase [Phellopilus nigrolimitatus]